MEKNAILAAVLSLAVLVGWEFFYVRPQQEEALKKKQELAQREAAKAPAPVVQGSPLAPPPKTLSTQALAPAPSLAPAPAAKPAVAAKEKRVRVDVGSAIYEFTNIGAGMTSATLTKYLTDDRKKPIELIVGSSKLVRPLFFVGDEAAGRLNAAPYQVEGGDIQLTPSKPEGKLRFVYRDTTGLAATKTFTFYYDSYVIGASIETGRPGTPKPMGIMWGPRLGGAGGNTYGGVVEGPMSFVDEDLIYDAPEKGKPAAHPAGTKWVSLQSKYFIAALVPRGGEGGTEVRLLGGEGEKQEYAAAALLPKKSRSQATFDIYVGPKETGLLSKLNVSLEESLDYGMFAIIAKPLMYALRLFHGLTGNWGVAIILLTILIKLVFFPLTQISMSNMRNMQKLQPKMTQLKEIYKDDKTKLNQEVMALYKEHKVNPMMGCLPMVIQIPVFFGLYNSLLVSIELRQAPFFWWITDLSQQDPFHVFTILMGASMFLQQKMTPSTADPAQAKMMMLMPVVFTGMFVYYPVPVGLVIYWFMNNALSILQQYYVNRSVKPPKLAEEN